MATTEDIEGQQADTAADLREHRQDTPRQNMTGDGGATAAAGDHGRPKKPSLPKRITAKFDLDVQTLLMMIKGSMAPTIAIAIYQSDAVASTYSTLGYLVAIISLLSMPIMPRGKFLQNLLMNSVMTCVGAAMALLMLWSSVQARLHTVPPDAPRAVAEGYNSSQSVVCAIWLIVQIFIVNVVRSARPQFQFPCIIYSIFVIVAASYGALMTTTAAIESFVKRLLYTFFTGFALGTGVHFFFVPVSSRTVVFKQMNGYMKLLEATLKAECAYIASLEDIDPMKMRQQQEQKAREQAERQSSEHHHLHLRHQHHDLRERFSPLNTPASQALKGVVAKVLELHAKLAGDLPSAKRDVALGKLSARNLTEIWHLQRHIFVPVLGMTAVTDVLERRAARGHWDEDDVSPELEKDRHGELESLHFTMQQLKEPLADITTLIGQAFQHVALVLEFEKEPKSKKGRDVENVGDVAVPGSPGFAQAYKKKIDAYNARKPEELRFWCHQRGIELPENFFESGNQELPEGLRMKDETLRDRYQRNLFFILYMEYLTWRAGSAALDLVLYVDSKKQDGTLSKTKLLFPGKRQLSKWMKAIFLHREDMTSQDSYAHDLTENSADLMYMGEEFTKRKDPDHLPPTDTMEKFGDMLRIIPRFFRTEHAAFGLRAAAAVMTIGVVGYLKDTQQWYIENRLLWAEIMIAFSMHRNAGQSTYNFVMRVLGTVVAMIGAYIIWYIVDGKTAGVIVFLWLWITASYWVVLKRQKMLIIGILSSVTSVLIIGYELQVQKIGKEAAESNGQPAYPTYILAPYRLAAVAGGLLVAYIWTIFPYPISEGSEIRKDLGASIYLLANFYSVVHETIQSRIKGTDNDRDQLIKGTHAYRLEKARMAVFTKLTTLLTNIETNAAFSKFQLRVGGRFPEEDYATILLCCRRLLSYITLMGYASRTYSVTDHQSPWSNDFRKLFTEVAPTTHEITSLLALLSSSITGGHPLPPYIALPQPYEIIRKLHDMHSGVLSLRHIAEPEYSALAVIQLCTQSVTTDVELLTRLVQTLVGTMDFSFHAVRAKGTASTSSMESLSSDDKSKEE